MIYMPCEVNVVVMLKMASEDCGVALVLKWMTFGLGWIMQGLRCFCTSRPGIVRAGHTLGGRAGWVANADLMKILGR